MFMIPHSDTVSIFLIQIVLFVLPVIEQRGQQHLLRCDLAETVRWWMNHGEYSPEQISRFFFDTTPFV